MANATPRRPIDRGVRPLDLKMRNRLAITLIVIAHLAVAIPFGYGLNIWADEASSLHSTQNGITAAFWASLSDEKQAPLYFVLLSGWRYINDSIAFARLFSVIFSVAAIIVFSVTARRVFSQRAAIVATALFAVHPFLIWASAEIRLYSLVIFLTCVLIETFFRGFLSSPEKNDQTHLQRKYQAVFALVAAASLYTNYYLGSLLVGFFIALLVYDRQRAKLYFYWMVGVGIAFVPMIFAVLGQLTGRIVAYSDPPSVLEIARITWTNIQTFVLPIEIYAGDDATLLSSIRSWLMRVVLLTTAAVLIVKRHNLGREIATIAIVTTASMLFLVFVYFQIGLDQAGIRHASIYFASVVFLAYGVGYRMLPDRALPVVVALLLASYFYTTAVMYPQYTKRGDWHRVANFVAENSTTEQPIVVFPVYETIAFSQNFRGGNQVLPTDRVFSFSYEAEHGSPYEYASQIEFIIANIPPDADKVWLVNSDKCDIGIACQPLESFVEANYNVILDQQFYRERVRLLQKKK